MPMEHEQEAPGEELPLYEDWQTSWEEYTYKHAKEEEEEEEEAGDTEKDGDAVMNDVKEDAVMEMPKEVVEEISSPEGLQVWYYIVPGGAYIKVMEMEDGLQLKRAPFEEGEEEWARRKCTIRDWAWDFGKNCQVPPMVQHVELTAGEEEERKNALKQDMKKSLGSKFAARVRETRKLAKPWPMKPKAKMAPRLQNLVKVTVAKTIKGMGKSGAGAATGNKKGPAMWWKSKDQQVIPAAGSKDKGWKKDEGEQNEWKKDGWKKDGWKKDGWKKDGWKKDGWKKDEWKKDEWKKDEWKKDAWKKQGGGEERKQAGGGKSSGGWKKNGGGGGGNDGAGQSSGSNDGGWNAPSWNAPSWNDGGWSSEGWKKK